MERVIQALYRTRTVDTMLDIVRQAAATRGVVGQSYHFTPKFSSQVSGDVIVDEAGFPKRWVSLYNSEDFRIHDPIPDKIMAEGRPLAWSDAAFAERPTPGVKNFMSAWIEHGLIFGIGIPLYGPHNQNAYSSFAFADASPLKDRETITYLQMIMQAAHSRICEVVEADYDDVTLSEREAEVLKLAAIGQNARQISASLSISPETVSTYLGRAYDKLDAKDRVSAVVKALKLGLIVL